MYVAATTVAAAFRAKLSARVNCESFMTKPGHAQ